MTHLRHGSQDLGASAAPILRVQGRQVDAGVVAAQLGVCGQRTLPVRVGDLPPFCAIFSDLLQYLPRAGLLRAGIELNGLLSGY